MLYNVSMLGVMCLLGSKEVVMVMCSGKTEEKVTATVDGKNMSSNGDHFINHLEHLCSSTGLVYS